MKVSSITYPTDLEKCDAQNDNIDVFVELENGKEYCVTVATLEWVKNDMINGFHPAGTPEIIVTELKDDIIRNAIEDYCVDDAYWLRLFSVSYGDDLPD